MLHSTDEKAGKPLVLVSTCADECVAGTCQSEFSQCPSPSGGRVCIEPSSSTATGLPLRWTVQIGESIVNLEASITLSLGPVSVTSSVVEARTPEGGSLFDLSVQTSQAFKATPIDFAITPPPTGLETPPVKNVSTPIVEERKQSLPASPQSSSSFHLTQKTPNSVLAQDVDTTLAPPNNFLGLLNRWVSVTPHAEADSPLRTTVACTTEPLPQLPANSPPLGGLDQSNAEAPPRTEQVTGDHHKYDSALPVPAAFHVDPTCPGTQEVVPSVSQVEQCLSTTDDVSHGPAEVGVCTSEHPQEAQAQSDCGVESREPRPEPDGETQQIQASASLENERGETSEQLSAAEAFADIPSWIRVSVNDMAFPSLSTSVVGDVSEPESHRKLPDTWTEVTAAINDCERQAPDVAEHIDIEVNVPSTLDDAPHADELSHEDLPSPKAVVLEATVYEAEATPLADVAQAETASCVLNAAVTSGGRLSPPAPSEQLEGRVQVAQQLDTMEPQQLDTMEPQQLDTMEPQLSKAPEELAAAPSAALKLETIAAPPAAKEVREPPDWWTPAVDQRHVVSLLAAQASRAGESVLSNRSSHYPPVKVSMAGLTVVECSRSSAKIAVVALDACGVWRICQTYRVCTYSSKKALYSTQVERALICALDLEQWWMRKNVKRKCGGTEIVISCTHEAQHSWPFSRSGIEGWSGYRTGNLDTIIDWMNGSARYEPIRRTTTPLLWPELFDHVDDYTTD